MKIKVIWAILNSNYIIDKSNLEEYATKYITDNFIMRAQDDAFIFNHAQAFVMYFAS